MDQNNIFAPFLGMMLLTIFVWFYMNAKRIRFIINNKLVPDRLTPVEFAKLQPAAVSNPSDNLKNLFEVPTLFYAFLIFLYVSEWVDQIYLVGAWLFLSLRIAHSLVHCTVNIVLLRFSFYAISAIILWLMIIRAAITIAL